MIASTLGERPADQLCIRRSILCESLVDTIVLVMGEVAPEQAKQVATVEDDDGVEALSARAADQALGNAMFAMDLWGRAASLVRREVGRAGEGTCAR